MFPLTQDREKFNRVCSRPRAHMVDEKCSNFLMRPNPADQRLGVTIRIILTRTGFRRRARDSTGLMRG